MIVDKKDAVATQHSSASGLAIAAISPEIRAHQICFISFHVIFVVAPGFSTLVAFNERVGRIIIITRVMERTSSNEFV